MAIEKSGLGKGGWRVIKWETSTNMGVIDSQPTTLNIQEALDFAGRYMLDDPTNKQDFELYAIQIQDYFVRLPRLSQRWAHRNCNPVWEDSVPYIPPYRTVISCDNPKHRVETPVIFILGGARYEDLEVIWDSDANYFSFDAEDKRECCECQTQEGLTTIQTGTYCYDCLPINLGAESERGPICPICYNYIPTNENPGAYPGALARYDNETEICSDCGTAEALAGMMAGPEAIAEWESSDRTWRDYQMLIMTTKSNIPEIMFGRGPEMEQLRELQKKMDEKNSEQLNARYLNARTQLLSARLFGRPVVDEEYPMAINMSYLNYNAPFVFEGLGSLFGAESKDDKVFGVQRHDAHRAGLHYDLRLERDGVLKSWSIPKGMPTDNRHLAIATDDHAMSWLDFDGDIPDGTYGAGKVSLDNKSTFQTVSYSPKKWVFYVNSGKYEGKYTLVHWQDNKWLISRNRDQSMSAETREFNAWYDLATDKQRDYIKRLGGDPHPDLNRRQASKLINQLARMKRALDQIDVVVDEEPYDAEDTFVSRDYPPCYLCGQPAKLDVMTAVGRRQFCNNRCRGEYEGVDYGEYPSEELEHSLEIVEYYPGFSDYDYVEDSTIDIRCRNC